MADITPRRNQIQQEETRFQAAVSESTMSRVGAGINFINTAQMTQHDFNLNGRFNIIVAPYQFGDGYITYPYAFEIVHCMLFTGEDVGTGGTTEIDIKWAPEDGSSPYASIFSTTPKFTSAASPNTMVRNGGPGQTGMTAPILSKSQFDAYDVLRLDVLQTTTGPVNGVFVKLFIRPINPLTP